ncbi:hypothetical protein BC826DRAFT_1105424 [Russula brevipes]|nr:hypothetical protein BC826DRAFT_1105424 [Russula brevipes]
MFLFDLFADFARPFRDTYPQMEDSDDEESMSFVDDASEAGLPDALEANADMHTSAPTYIPGALATSDRDLDCLPIPPASPHSPSAFHELHMLDDRTTQFSRRSCVLRRARSSARHSAYSLPSWEQRQSFKKRHSRCKKDMFVEEPQLPVLPPVEPTPVFSMANLVLDSLPVEAAAAPINAVELNLLSQFTAQCSLADPCKAVDSVLTRTSMLHDARLATIQRSGLTIRIPSLVDRLALRLLGSCSVTEQAEEDEEVDALSLDGYAASESSTSDTDADDDYDYPLRSLLREVVPGPDRSSRRSFRRRVAAPYRRAGGKSKRKELWVDIDARAESRVPAFLLGLPTTEPTRARVL